MPPSRSRREREGPVKEQDVSMVVRVEPNTGVGSTREGKVGVTEVDTTRSRQRVTVL